MDANLGQNHLYWQGGPFYVSIGYPSGASKHAVSEVIEILEEFRSACQMQYTAFNTNVNGRHLAYERFIEAMHTDFRDRPFYVGATPPDAEQLPGKSTIAAMTQGEFLEALKEGGEFENQHSKACVVMIYHLWEDNFRKRIAHSLSVSKDKIECTLMGDIRRLRNYIIHDNSIVPKDFSSQQLELLSQIWKINPGELKITEKMTHSFIEQVNAISIKVNIDS